jgi:hypothetical protein
MVSKILTAISDDKSLVLFNAIALSSGENSDILISKLGLTKKQYYSRMSALTNAGLTSRSNGRHFLTSLGKVVYKAQLLIGKGKQNIWKLKAIDSIESSLQGSTIEERIKVVESIIQDDDLKEILFGSNKNKERDRHEQHFDDQVAVQPQSLSWSGKHKDNVM